MATPMRTPFSRVFTIEDRAGPAQAPKYQSLGRAQAVSQAFGDLTPIRVPDPNQYGRFIVIDTIRGERGLPTMTLQARYQFTVSDFLRIARKGCPLDIQIHMGKCQNPTDFNGGWDKILVLEGSNITQWNTNELGALEQGEDAVVNEEIPTSSLDLYEIKPLLMSAIASTQIVMEVIDVAICDTIQCGVCGVPSNGCQAIFMLQLATTGSPGLSAELVSSRDRGVTLLETNILSLPANRNPTALTCVGTRLLVTSNDDCSLHYAFIADVLAGTSVWTRVATGLVCPTGAPNDLFSIGALATWIVGNGGYVYFTSDPTAGVTVQDAGIATTQNLNAIHGIDDQNLVAVGNSNAVIFTRNGGATWSSITGPAVGVALNTIWMRSELEWFIGTAGGRLFYTRNRGTTWIEKTFPGSGAGQVRDVAFATPTVGYMSHDTAVPAGRILRSLDGGNSWYVLPEGAGAIPANSRINALDACGEDPNFVLGGGLDGGTDGIAVLGQ